ncbi:hypothetical protein [Haliangium sp. UPWRP_2]|uniref:hypothetical protein n=1 Tax=Haliangium sp. UPWRP_2 TaxID=1931276 RepID=UPI001E3F0C14|nr:hypothetical protein [Haliangium sp. UPWRP_2]
MPKVSPPGQSSVEDIDIRKDRDRLAEQVARLTQENDSLGKRVAALCQELERAQRPTVSTQQGERPAAASPSLRSEALRLLRPFGESLEQASAALLAGDAQKARELIRDASFELASLQDLFSAEQRGP